MVKHNPFLYYGKKVLIFFLSVFLLSVIVFYVARKAPGDPLVSYYGERAEKMSPEEREWAMEKLGLNEPIPVQYLRWAENALHGNFGISFKYKQDVMDVISGRISNTLVLGGIGFVFIFIFALLLGVLCAWYEERWPDKIICKIGTITSCIPDFWFSLVLILIFAVYLRVLPSSGAYTIGKEQDFADRALHLMMPLTVVTIEHLWYYAYMIRNKILEEVRADYVLLAKAKGLNKRSVMFRHCLRNIMPAYLSIMAIAVPHILGGTYIVETVFSYPGIGTLSYESARYHDYNLLMVICMMSGILVIFFNMLSQIINEHIDPRVKANDVPETSEVTNL
ncbi:MAG: ABC transporter permease [Lachnospiraceae bacterium]